MSRLQSPLEKRRNCARETLRYRIKTGAPADQIAQAKKEFDDLTAACLAARPERVSIDPSSRFFIGPRRGRGKRGSGPTIVCFRCHEEKPVADFYAKGTICRKCTAARAAEWAEENPEKRRLIVKLHGKNNREKKNKATRDRYWSDPEKARERNRLYSKTHRHIRTATAVRYQARKRKTCPVFRLRVSLRQRIWRLLRGVGKRKGSKTEQLIGMKYADFVKYIESLWLPGMTWGNYSWSGWHVDHKRPCALFDFSDPEQVAACCHYTNLQPMWAEDNWAKGKKIV